MNSSRTQTSSLGEKSKSIQDAKLEFNKGREILQKNKSEMELEMRHSTRQTRSSMGALLKARLVCSIDRESWRQWGGMGLFSQGEQ